jgi:dTDP-4-dehydrorhamnose reductase
MKKIFLTGSTSFLGTKFIDLYGNRFEIFGISEHDPSWPIDILDFKALKKACDSFKPDIIIHVAAALGIGIEGEKLTATNPQMTQNIINLARSSGLPVIFTSTEAVYGGKEQAGEYREADPYKPRNKYGESKVESEKIVMQSGLPYLIIRGHRYVGISKRCAKPKRFSDTLRDLVSGKEVHLDAHKLFKPVLINHICYVLEHYIAHDIDKQVILNVGTDRESTYHGFILDVADKLGLDTGLVQPDGEEKGWPQNSTLSFDKLKSSGYPVVNYKQLLDAIQKDFND